MNDGWINRREKQIQSQMGCGESRKDAEEKGEERAAGRVTWVARGEYVRLLLRTRPAIGSYLLSRREAEEEREK